MTAVVFDFGAVLFHWQPLALLRQAAPDLAGDDGAARAVAARIFESFTPDSDWAHFDLGRVDEATLAGRIGARIGCGPEPVRRVIDAIPAHMVPVADSVTLFRELAAAGHRMYYLSNMPLPYALHLERENAFVAEFADGIFSSRVGLMKPAAEIFRLATERFRLEPARTLFIDDHVGNVEAACAQGWQGLRFTSAADCRAELLRLGWLDGR